MTKVPAGKIENGRIARSFFVPDFHTDEERLASRVLEDFYASHEKAQAGIIQHATTSISRDGIIHVLQQIRDATQGQLSFFTEQYPVMPDGTRPTLPYPALVNLSHFVQPLHFQARYLLTALLNEDDVRRYIEKKGNLTHPSVMVFGRQALQAYEKHFSLDT